MTEQTLPTELSEQEREQRQALFQYTDLSHPVMQTLFNLQLDLNNPLNTEE